jgi:phosphoribosylformylglycinamidine cyclo-ligase
MKSVTYEESGVDIKKADNLLDDIKSKIQKTFNPYVLNTIGAFAALTEVPKDYKNPVLVSSTDGVGTKLKIAFMAGKHDTVGIDLVGMSVNDILTLGARPFFFSGLLCLWSHRRQHIQRCYYRYLRRLSDGGMRPHRR